jgi:hypothetical protein
MGWLSPEYRAIEDAREEAAARARYEAAHRPPPAAKFFSGLDLGQAQDYSALAVVERIAEPDPERAGKFVYRFDVRHMHRWALGTPYPRVVSDVGAWFARPPLAKSALAVDQTGVGRAVLDLFRASGVGATLRPLTITGGEGGKGTTVAKKNLVGALQVPLQTRRIRIPASLPLASELATELEAFRVKVTASRNEAFEAWRERDHDDMVVALALALYLAQRPEPVFAVFEA